jgi:signal transduction histidine kinase
MNRLQRLLQSSTIRLGLLASLLIWIASSTVAIAIYHFTLLALIDEAGKQLDRQQTALLKGIDDLAAEAEPSRWLYRRLSGQIAQTPYCLRLIDSEGEVLISNAKQEQTPVFKNDELFSIQRIERDNNLPSTRCLAREIILKDGGIFHFGIAFENTINIIGQLDRLRFWGLLSSAVLSLLIGSAISLRGLKGLQKINIACVHVAQGDLSHRIPVSDYRDDFDRLAETINAMLDQIGQLMSGVSRVSDAIAHDLRTPLARMRNQIELMQQKDGASEELNVLTQQLDHILNAFNALLRIAQLEQGSLRQAFTHFDFRDVLSTALSLYELVFDEKSIQLTIHQHNTALPCFGDRDLWIQALSNLLDNAYKYTPENGHVTIMLEKRAQQIYLTVRDSGPGIPKAEHSNVFTRFYRLESHRSQSGTGLGLSLVRAVCNVHHATITLDDNTLDVANNPATRGLAVCIAIPMDLNPEQSIGRQTSPATA